MITIGTDAAASAAAIEMARAHDGVWATVGLHPHDAVDGVDGIAALLTDPDPRSWSASASAASTITTTTRPGPVQRQAFAAQVGLAAELDLALVVHTREAWDDTFDILAAEGVPDRWVLHCFTGGPTEAKRGLDLGAYPVLQRDRHLQDRRRGSRRSRPVSRRPAARRDRQPVPGPVPYRGRPNRPALVPVVGRRGG